MARPKLVLSLLLSLLPPLALTLLLPLWLLLSLIAAADAVTGSACRR